MIYVNDIENLKILWCLEFLPKAWTQPYMTSLNAPKLLKAS